MSSIGGLSSYASTGASGGLHGYGGLASGIDRDEIIKQLTASIQSKIDRKNQQKTSLQWEQELIRNITDKMFDFSQKYMSYSSGSNLMGTGLFSKNDISVHGPYADFISVSGSTQASDFIELLGVKSLAQQAYMKSNSNASNRLLELGEVSTNLDDTTDVNMVAGQTISLKVGNTKYSVKLLKEREDGTNFDYSTPEGVAEAINESLKKVSVGDDKTLADSVSFSAEPGGKLVINNVDTAGNSVEIAGGTSDVLQRLGFLKEGENLSDLDDSRKIIASGESLTAQEVNTAIEAQSIAKQLGGQSISFVYNGKVKWIEMPSEEELNGKDMSFVQEHIQKELDKAVGKGRIRVDLTESSPGKSKLSFQTTIPKTVNGEVVCGENDEMATLSISSATGNLLGDEGLLGAQPGVSNRLNLNASLKDSGLAGFIDGMFDGVPEGEALLTINGVAIEGITADSSINEIIEAINSNKDAGVTIKYEQNTDKFTITSNQNGASGEVKLEGKMAEALFGTKAGGELDTVYSQGKDAVFAVRYPGSSEITEIVRDSNTLEVDGLIITANNTFGYNDAGEIEDESKVTTFSADVDAEKTSEIVQEMVDEFNEILKLINDEIKTKPNRDYQPLTPAQKAEMSESEIEAWEKKAKEGTLFGDSDLRGLTDALRFAIPPEIRSDLEKIGITTSKEYSDNGKLVFDKNKFEAALKENPEEVRLLFSAKAETKEDGTKTKGGLMTNMKVIMDKYASMNGSTKGILVERAGSEHSLLSTMDNALLREMNQIDKDINKLLNELKNTQDRYISQFTALESLVAQMNAQSSYLGSMFA